MQVLRLIHNDKYLKLQALGLLNDNNPTTPDTRKTESTFAQAVQDEAAQRGAGSKPVESERCRWSEFELKWKMKKQKSKNKQSKRNG